MGLSLSFDSKMVRQPHIQFAYWSLSWGRFHAILVLLAGSWVKGKNLPFGLHTVHRCPWGLGDPHRFSLRGLPFNRHLLHLHHLRLQ